MDWIEFDEAELVAPPNLVAALSALGQRRRVRKGQMLLSEGSESTDVLFIDSGLVQISLFGNQGQETILRNLPAGRMFGEMSAIDGRPRSASVTALEDSDLIVVSASQFERFMLETPGAGNFVARLLTHRVRSLTGKLQSMAHSIALRPASSKLSGYPNTHKAPSPSMRTTVPAWVATASARHPRTLVNSST